MLTHKTIEDVYFVPTVPSANRRPTESVRFKWNEADHPRAPEGSENGGQFVSADGGGAGADGASGQGADPKETTGLHYDKDKKRWMRSDGKPVSDETAARLKAAGVKPGYVDVKLNPDPTAALQATGKDTKGRTQYLYSKEHSEAAAAEKFARLGDFNKVVPQVREQLTSMVGNGNLTGAHRDAAAALALIGGTGIRIGSDAETGGATKAYGATTLLGKHITLGDNGKVELRFPGKHGQENVAVFHSPVLHSYLSSKKVGPEDRVFATDDKRVRGLMKEVAGPDFSPKDFRTWHGTATALQELKGKPIPTSTKEYQKLRSEVAKVVATKLNNTPAVALSAYIDPAVFKQWGGPHATAH